MYKRNTILFAAIGMALVLISACTSGGEPELIEPSSKAKLSSESQGSSAREGGSSSSIADDSLPGDFTMFDIFDWQTVPAGRAIINSVKFDYAQFMMATTEVTQIAYATMMDDMPKQPRYGSMYPVVNVSWFDAVLFCNEFSKNLGFDTAYTYTSVGNENFLENVSIDYGARAIRLPTEIEWEIAAHGGTDTRFYWGVEIASNYAYYGQSKGPEEVARFVANDFGFYDMAGNAAEWVNDWYTTFPTKDQSNYSGPSQGSLRVVRGGGWSDAIKDCAPDVREKKDPLYASMTLGFRVVYTEGF